MDDTEDLIERLLVIAAGIMEDASAALVLRGERSLTERVELVQQAARELGAIGGAVAVLHHQAARD